MTEISQQDIKLAFAKIVNYLDSVEPTQNHLRRDTCDVTSDIEAIYLKGYNLSAALSELGWSLDELKLPNGEMVCSTIQTPKGRFVLYINEEVTTMVIGAMNSLAKTITKIKKSWWRRRLFKFQLKVLAKRQLKIIRKRSTMEF